MLEELKEEIDKKFRIADKTIQGNSIRLDNFEQIAEEMRRLKRKEPTMLELQKFEEKWKQNNEDILTKLRLLENALHNRTERILRFYKYLIGLLAWEGYLKIQNFFRAEIINPISRKF